MLVTARLELTPVTAADVVEVYRLYSSREGWDHWRGGRHQSMDQTHAMIAKIEEGWRRAGLDYWAARERETGDMVGIGGVKQRASATWTLGYRVAVERWGQGFATELATAALQAAEKRAPDLPVVAWIAESNGASKRVAERVGLRDEGMGTDPSDGQRRRAFVRRNRRWGSGSL